MEYQIYFLTILWKFLSHYLLYKYFRPKSKNGNNRKKHNLSSVKDFDQRHTEIYILKCLE